MVAEAEAALTRERPTGGEGSRAQRLPPAYFLAISGGGDDGAFGAGLLCGWSGLDPDFQVGDRRQHRRNDRAFRLSREGV